jgi:hypothetical protein
MADRRRSKLEVLVAVLSLAVVLGGVLVVSTTPTQAIVALEYLVICHYQVQSGEYSEFTSPGAMNGHMSHKEDLILPPASFCPQKKLPSR